MSLLTPVIKKAGTPPVPPTLEGKRFDQEQLLSLSIIRQHTKTDDVPRVTDELLRLYRSAALAAAEQYTGMLLREQRVVRQSIADKSDITRGARPRQFYTVRLEYPTADGLLYLYGGRHSIAVTTVTAEPGATKVRLPVNHYALDMTPCCGDPCGKLPLNAGMTLMYRAGMASEEDLPPCISAGALKYIAWMISNPGDEALAGVNMANVNPQAGRNNTAWQSGAIEEWRLCVSDAI